MFGRLFPAFLIALLTSFFATPAVRSAARRLGLVDLPSKRKVHLRAVPRVGGVAILGSFLVAVFAVCAISSLRHSPIPLGAKEGWLLLGGLVAFGIGVWDDIRGLRASYKLALHVLAALLAYAAGVRIPAIELPGSHLIELGALSLPVTVLWFLLVINAINLIDGLDGLAAGVSFFSSCVLFLSLGGNAPVFVALGFAALAGSTLGFLRYNFNPASIFMGDGGSYFIGYTLAALSILGAIKGQTGVAILIPVLALGLPLMDTLWSAVRRFLRGKALFSADMDHIHHRLIALGYTHRRAVLLLYGITAALGTASLLMVRANNRQATFLLLLIALGMGIMMRRLGYVDYLTSEKLLGWLRDVTDAIGMDGGQRTFLGLQQEIAESKSMEDAWRNIVKAAKHLKMDYVSLELSRNGNGSRRLNSASLGGNGTDLMLMDRVRLLQIGFPVGDALRPSGYVQLVKDLSKGEVDYHILRRVEHLRRTVSDVLPALCNTVPEVVLSPRSHMPTSLPVASGAAAERSHLKVLADSLEEDLAAYNAQEESAVGSYPHGPRAAD